MNDPAVWASFVSLLALEIILGVDNVIFISIAASNLPKHQQRPARIIGLTIGLVLRIALLFSIAWIASLTEPVITMFGFDFSWRDIILLLGGLFLIWKASSEIFNELETEEAAQQKTVSTFTAVIAQIIVLDVVFSLDSVITAVGIADHVEVMVAAIIIAVIVMIVASEPVAAFVAANPSTKMLSLAFLVMVGVALLADGFHRHIDRELIYAAMAFAGLVEVLNLVRAKRRSKRT